VKETWEIRFSGTGGQGIILAGIMLAEAAVIEGLNAVQSQVYGPESRGGASKSEVIVSRGTIDYPKVTEPDVLLVMSQEAADRYAPTVGKGGLLIVDSTHVHHVPEVEARVLRAEVSGVARDELGKEIVASAVAVGLLVGLTGVVGEESLRRAVELRVPRGTTELNVKAMQAGLRLAETLGPAET